MNRRRFITTGLSLPLVYSSGLFAKWSEAPQLPFPIQEIYPAIHQNSLVVAGGIFAKPDGSLGVTDRVVGFDFASQQWKDLPSLPEPRHHPILSSVDDKLYAFSGFVGSERGTWYASNDVLVLEKESTKWQRIERAAMPFAMCETATATIDGKIHLASGRKPYSDPNGQWRDHKDISDHLQFDPKTGTWTTQKPIPTARNSGASTVVDHNWFVIGGRTVDGGNLATNEVWLASEQQWLSLKPMPQAQGGLAAASLNKNIYVFGGEFFNDGGGVYSEVWEYDIAEDNWRLIDKMPVPRHGLGAVTVDDSIYVVAGAAAVGGRDTSPRMSVFRP